MAKRRHGKRHGYNQFARQDCLGCGGSVPTELRSLEASDGMSCGWFPLCEHCYAQYRSLNDARARDYFLDCLTEVLLERLVG